MSNLSIRLDQVLEGRAPEFLGDDDPTIGPAGAPITNAAQLRAAIAGAGGTLYVWALPPAYPTEVQIALQSGGFKVQPDLSDPGSYRIMLATPGAPAAPGTSPLAGFSLAGLGLDANTIILGAVALAGIAILTKVLK